MESPLRHLRFRLIHAGLLPASKLTLITAYLMGLDFFLWVLGKIFGFFGLPYGQSLGSWVIFLSVVVVAMFSFLAIRWLREKLLWRLRNRLIITWIFIGVIPSILLVALLFVSFYLFAGQFATFIVTTGLNSELQALDATNSTIAHELAARIQEGANPEVAAIDGLRRTHEAWADRQLCVWLNGKIILHSSPAPDQVPPVLPPHLKTGFYGVVRDQNRLFLRSSESLQLQAGTLTVLSSEPFDQHRLLGLANNLGEVTLYASGTGELIPTYTAGAVPPPTRGLDHQVTFPTTVKVMDWGTGGTSVPAAIGVQTRYSKLRDRIFDASGDFASTAELILALLLCVFGVIELVALLIGIRLTRSVTGAVDQLYQGTRHINSGEFSYRIPVQSKDQLATLANSFNLMTASLEKLIEEQKQKQRLENELVIAQEVQAQLFPQHISQPATLEIYGFCRPARTVSGDYYDFLTMDADKLLLAVGDISGKGISAALLMATVHSAVRAYSLEGVPTRREQVAVGALQGSGKVPAAEARGSELSPAALLSLLNHQLFESTPAEKYATLFAAVYDGKQRKLTYSNGGHLPPIILGESHSIRKLDQGGTVVGLFDHRSYDEASVHLHSGEIFLAYSDGVTEPENDFGEFGERRLINLVRENRDLPLARISEIVTAAVDDWIGPNEQPDDVTLVLARAR